MDDSFIDEDISLVCKKPLNLIKYQEEDSGLKAWEHDFRPKQNHTDILKNLKNQLLSYEEKYKKHNSSNTAPIKLPVIAALKQQIKPLKHQVSQQQIALTERKTLEICKVQNLYKHKSIEINKKPLSKDSKRSTVKKQKLNHKSTFGKVQQKNQNVLITKIQQVKFNQNQKRIRKRDLYLAIFGQRGKSKIQKIYFDDENKQYLVYLQKKNERMKVNNELGPQSFFLDRNHKPRCSTQMNNPSCFKKPESINQRGAMMPKNNSHLPIRY